MIQRRPRARFWIEGILALLSGTLALLTFLVPDWLEVYFRIEPDGGSGAVEAAVTVLAILMTVVFSFAGRMEWRSGAAPASGDLMAR